MHWKNTCAGLINRVIARADMELVRRSDRWRPASQLGKQPVPPDRPATHQSPGFFRVFGRQSQLPYDFSVITTSILRPTLRDAVRSVVAQDFPGTIQMLVGIDRVSEAPNWIETLGRNLPENRTLVLFFPGYSTSSRHGGLHPAWDGGAIRTMLSYLANSRHLGYLDDDNWWAPEHVSSMRAALEGHDWAYARRSFAHPHSRVPICEDEWESIGPDAGAYRDIGGWVDPNCLAIDKLNCEAVLRWWAIPLRNSPKAMDADRNVFRVLRSEFKGQTTGRCTVFYPIDETDVQHPFRLRMIGRDRFDACGTRAAAMASQAQGATAAASA